jgi:DNA-binding SARP family transcriptional activator
VLEYRILGPVEVVGETGPLSLGGPRQRAVLALLILNAGSVVSTDRTVDQIWGEHPPKAVVASLQNFVAQLRRLLGADALVRKPPGGSTPCRWTFSASSTSLPRPEAGPPWSGRG